MAQPQTFKNHGRIDPLFHYFILPVFVLNIIAVSIWYARHFYPHIYSGGGAVLVSVTLLVLAVRCRMYALQNQDRIIRLEEQLRLADLLPESQLSLVDQVTLRQYIALRFASDIELPALAARAVAEGLTEKQIKESIQAWRPDNHRV
jgi:hypothetical protein